MDEGPTWEAGTAGPLSIPATEKRWNSKHKWTQAEHDALAAAIEQAQKEEPTGKVRWPNVSKILNNGRTSKQCRERWLNTRPDAKKGLWSVEEEVALAECHARLGAQWGRIMVESKSERSGDAIKNHWNSLWRCKVIDTRPETVLTLYVYMLRCGAPAEKALGYAQELLEQRRAIDHSERCSMSKAIEQYLRERGEYVKPADVPEDEAQARPAFQRPISYTSNATQQASPAIPSRITPGPPGAGNAAASFKPAAPQASSATASPSTTLTAGISTERAKSVSAQPHVTHAHGLARGSEQRLGSTEAHGQGRVAQQQQGQGQQAQRHGAAAGEPQVPPLPSARDSRESTATHAADAAALQPPPQQQMLPVSMVDVTQQGAFPLVYQIGPNGEAYPVMHPMQPGPDGLPMMQPMPMNMQWPVPIMAMPDGVYDGSAQYAPVPMFPMQAAPPPLMLPAPPPSAPLSKRPSLGSQAEKPEQRPQDAYAPGAGAHSTVSNSEQDAGVAGVPPPTKPAAKTQPGSTVQQQPQLSPEEAQAAAVLAELKPPAADRSLAASSQPAQPVATPAAIIQHDATNTLAPSAPTPTHSQGIVISAPNNTSTSEPHQIKKSISMQERAEQGSVLAGLGQQGGEKPVRCLTNSEAVAVLKDMKPALLEPQEGGGYVLHLVPKTRVQAEQAQAAAAEAAPAQPQPLQQVGGDGSAAAIAVAAAPAQLQPAVLRQEPRLAAPAPPAPPRPQPAVAAPRQPSRSLILCHCGDSALVSVSMLPDTVGRLYYTCSKRAKDTTRCRFLLWGGDAEDEQDPPPPPSAMPPARHAEQPAQSSLTVAVQPAVMGSREHIGEPAAKRARVDTHMDVQEAVLKQQGGSFSFPTIVPPVPSAPRSPVSSQNGLHEHPNGNQALTKSSSGKSRASSPPAPAPPQPMPVWENPAGARHMQAGGTAAPAMYPVPMQVDVPPAAAPAITDGAQPGPAAVATDASAAATAPVPPAPMPAVHYVPIPVPAGAAGGATAATGDGSSGAMNAVPIQFVALPAGMAPGQGVPIMTTQPWGNMVVNGGMAGYQGASQIVYVQPGSYPAVEYVQTVPAHSTQATK